MSRKGVIGFILIALVVGLVVGYSVSIVLPYQSTQKPTITLSEISVKAGANYTATLTGFPANTKIYGWTVNQEQPSCFVAGTTNANGKLVVSACAPALAGTWPLVACDASQTHWAVTSMTVTNP
ncbi:MAG TPA: hypothetical protein VEF91_01430 [Verrucomicrobiae bacterium]|nr:hypothetical protein [Verrucomicrobiae bacterium]